jgi:hypothetical protein
MGNELSISFKDQAWATLREHKTAIDDVIEKIAQGIELDAQDLLIVNMCLMVVRGDIEYTQEEIKEIENQIDRD